MKTPNDLSVEFSSLNSLAQKDKPQNWIQLNERYPTATNDSNIKRNRYFDVLPSEQNRVHLSSVPGNSDYINASFISNFKYISTQAPLPHTMEHFWMMVWEQRSPIIVMLTKLHEKGRPKADLYWPKFQGETERYGNFFVTWTKSAFYSDIDVRSFKITFQDESREVIQLHYGEWPDNGCPESTYKIKRLIRLIKIFQTRLSTLYGLQGPVIGHCSAGIGRTGTLFACLIALDKLNGSTPFDSLNLMEIVHQMRKQRAGMIQTLEQYSFAYEVIRDIYLDGLENFPMVSERLHHLKCSLNLESEISFCYSGENVTVSP